MKDVTQKSNGDIHWGDRLKKGGLKNKDFTIRLQLILFETTVYSL